MARGKNLLCVLPLLFAVAGCIGHAEIADEVDSIAWDLRPLQLEPEVELSVGRAVLGLASTAAHFTNDPEVEFAADLLDEIDRVHVGVYALNGNHGDAPSDLGLDAREELEDLGWHVVVRSRENYGGSSWVMARPVRGDKDFEVLIVVLEDEEVVVVRVEGDMGALVDGAVRGDNDFVLAARHVESSYDD